jgi:putative ABC transport system ATP-binding protein
LGLAELRAVQKRYGSGSAGAVALREVSLEIAAGDYVSVVGASGSGKSTLLHILGLLDRPTAGSYRLRGREMTHLGGGALAAERNFGIGFVFQGFHLLPHLRLLHNVALPLVYRGVAAAERRRMAQAALEAVGLGHLGERLPTQVSGGQQQRAAIARALITQPDLILADEPTGALDSRTGEVIMAIFQQLHRRGFTLVQVTHEPDIARHARRIVTLRDGLIVGEERVSLPLDAAAMLANMPALPGGEAMPGVEG